MNARQRKALERAKSGLAFDDVYQVRADAWTAKDVDPKYGLKGAPLFLQFKHRPLRSSAVEIKSDDGSRFLFRVLIEFGVRLMRGNKDAPDQAGAVAQIEAAYHADYLVTNKDLLKDKEALDSFALINASHNVWPFWREYAMSQGQRMNLPRISIPLAIIPNDSQSEDIGQ